MPSRRFRATDDVVGTPREEVQRFCCRLSSLREREYLIPSPESTRPSEALMQERCHCRDNRTVLGTVQVASVLGPSTCIRPYTTEQLRYTGPFALKVIL